MLLIKMYRMGVSIVGGVFILFEYYLFNYNGLVIFKMLLLVLENIFWDID